MPEPLTDPGALLDDTVRRHALARADDQDVADLEVGGPHQVLAAATRDPGRVGDECEQRAEAVLRLVHGAFLERLGDGEEEGQGRSLPEASQRHRADGRECHQEPDAQAATSQPTQSAGHERPRPGGEGSDLEGQLHPLGVESADHQAGCEQYAGQGGKQERLVTPPWRELLVRQ